MLWLTLAACSDDVVERLSGDAGETSSGTTASTTSGPVGSTGSSASTTAPADDTRGTTDADTTEVLFFAEPDLGGQAYACSIFTQDCPSGQKCMPWSTDGGTWNAWGCKPVADDPAGLDEPCTVEGSGVSGLDDCDIGAICWDVDPETNQGTCVPLCTGPDHSTCDDPFRHCLIAADGVIRLCVPSCDPLQQDCPEQHACYSHNPASGAWQCSPDASGALGAYGDPCEFINVCDPGLVCLGAATVPPGEACEGAAGCCTEICDLSDPLGDQQCTGAAGGQQCVPWYDPGEAPPIYEDVGVCMVP